MSLNHSANQALSSIHTTGNGAMRLFVWHGKIVGDLNVLVNPSRPVNVTDIDPCLLGVPPEYTRPTVIVEVGALGQQT